MSFAKQTLEIATLAGGCFWCTEAVFRRLKGVISIESGYSGGSSQHPNYESVSSGRTGHTEAIQITFDPNSVSYQTLLDIFWKVHDPTTLNRQGADIGTQYRSAIFYHSPKQHEIAESSKSALQDQSREPVVTEIVPFASFTKAESYHQEYYEKHAGTPYCQVVIDPKIQKLYKEFKEQVKVPTSPR